jgi:hypothetical protein
MRLQSDLNQIAFLSLPFIKHHGFLAVCTRIYLSYWGGRIPLPPPTRPADEIKILVRCHACHNSLFFSLPLARLPASESLNFLFNRSLPPP